MPRKKPGKKPGKKKAPSPLTRRLSRQGLTEEEIKEVIGHGSPTRLKRIERRLAWFEQAAASPKGMLSYLFNSKKSDPQVQARLQKIVDRRQARKKEAAEKRELLKGFNRQLAARLAASKTTLAELKKKLAFLKTKLLEKNVHGREKLKQTEIEALIESPLHEIKRSLLPSTMLQLSRDYAFKWLEEKMGWDRKKVESVHYGVVTLKERVEAFQAQGITPTFSELVRSAGRNEKRLQKSIKKVAGTRKRVKKRQSLQANRAEQVIERFDKAGVPIPDGLRPYLSYPQVINRLKALAANRISLKKLERDGLLSRLYSGGEKGFKAWLTQYKKKGRQRKGTLSQKKRQALVKDIKQSKKLLKHVAAKHKVHYNTANRIKKVEGIFTPLERELIKPKANQLLRENFSREIRECEAFGFLAFKVNLPKKDLAFLFAAFPLRELDWKIALFMQSELVRSARAKPAFQAYRKSLRLTTKELKERIIPQLEKQFQAR